LCLSTGYCNSINSQNKIKLRKNNALSKQISYINYFKKSYPQVVFLKMKKQILSIVFFIVKKGKR